MSRLDYEIQPISEQLPAHHDADEKGEAFDDTTFKVQDAISAETYERDMTPLQALRSYPQSVFWSFCVSLCLIMEGYDTTLMGNLLALPTFRKHFGHRAKVGYQLDPVWQSALGYAPTIGAFCGIFISSYFQDKYGYRRTIQFNLILMAAFIFVVFFATSIEMLFVGELLCGLPWGAFSTSAVSYASEVTPIALRAYLTTYVNLCWVIGQLIGSGVINGVAKRTDKWAYKIPFAVQWFWPIPIFILVTLAPESPWYLVRKGRLEEAKRSIQRLKSKRHVIDPNAVVSMMVRTNDIEIKMHEGVTYWDCFKGVDLRRTEIVTVMWACQILTGSAFANHASYFFTQAGLSTVQAVHMDLGMRGVSFMGSVLCWFVMTYFGRRTIVLTGASILCAILLLVGILGTIAPHHHGAIWGEAALIVLWVFVWDSTLTPVVYAIVGETSSTRLRGKTVGLGRNLYNVVGIVAGILNTYQQNPKAWGWKGKAGFFWFGSCLLALVWAYFRLPECKGRSFRELDILFERKTPTKQFKHTVIDDKDDE